MHDIIGTEIKGYRLDGRIGSGGFGAVYRAHQASVDREVAIKVILPDHANNPKFIRNFDAEAHVIARLEHPFVVPLFDYWREPDGAYIVMRYFGGGSLAQLLLNEGALPAEEVSRILDQIASALDAAHRNDVIHRDIKPANILLDNERNAYLGDFGLAKNLTEETHDNRVVGSPAYIPPEIIVRQAPDARSDIYSLGLVVYEMLTGRYAYIDVTPDSSIHNILDFHLNTPLSDIAEQSDAVNAVIQRATAKDRVDRYPSAGAFASALREAIQHDGESHMIPAEIINPYKGLRAFEEADAGTFFGRDNLVERIINRMEEDVANANYLTLVGASGSGKSSVLYAGVLPALRKGAIPGSEDWFIVTTMPGAEPIKQLSAALHSVAIQSVGDIEAMLWQAPDSLLKLLPEILPSSDDTLLLVIDHFEEVFTQTANSKERKQFLALIREGLQSEHLKVMTLLRADFYDRPMMYEGFGELIQKRTEVVLPLNSSELHDVIIKPARMNHLKVEPELTAAMIADVREEVAALPLLQYALTEMFENKDSNTLTLDTYQKIGGVAGAVAHRADEIYDTLSPDEQKAARQIFLRLVTLGEGTEDTRRRARRSELLSVVDDNNRVLQSVLDTFGTYRLLTFDHDEETREPTVEVAHEALIREWQQLRQWLDDSRHDIRQQRAIYNDAVEWKNANHDESYLLRGAHLEELMYWSEGTQVSLNDLESHYLQASIDEMKRENEAEEQRQQHELALEEQSRQRLRYLVYVLLIAVGGAIILTTFAVIQSVQSIRLAALARSLALSASAKEALTLDESDTALALALEALDMDDSLRRYPPPLSVATFIDIAHAPGLIYERQIFDVSLDHIAVSPDGRYALLAHGLNQTDYWGFGRPPETAGRPVSFPPPDRIQLVLWNIEDREEVSIIKAHETPVTDMLFLPPTETEPYRAVTADGNGRVIFWDILNGTIQHELDNFQAGYTTLSTNEDGSLLLVTSSAKEEDREPVLDGHITLVDTETLAVVAETEELEPQLVLAELSPDGRFVVMLHRRGLSIVWDWEEEEIVARYQSSRGPRFASMNMTISPDGLAVATNIGQTEVVVWDIETGEEVSIARAGTTLSHRITFDSSGQYLLIVARDGLVTIWDVENNYLEATLTVSNNRITSFVPIADDGHALIGTDEGVMRVYAVEGDDVGLMNVFYDEGISFGGITLDDEETTYLISTQIDIPPYDDARLVLWDVNTGEFIDYLASLSNTNRTPRDLSISPDGQWLMATSNFGLRVWEITGDNLLREVQACALCKPRRMEDNRINAIFAPHTGVDDVPLVAIVSEDSSLYQWQLADNDEPELLADVDGKITDMDLSSDGEMVLLVVESDNRPPPNGQDDRPPPPEDAPPLPREDTGETYLYWIERASGNILHEIVVESDPTAIRFMPDSYAVAVGMQVPAESIITNEDYEGDDFYDIALIVRNDNTLAADPNVIAIINPENGEINPRFVGHQNAISTIRFSSDGQQMVTGGVDRNVIIWDVETGELFHTLPEETLVLDAMFTLDDTAILTITEDREPALWRSTPMTLEEAQTWASENRALRRPDESECRRYQMERFCHG